jgi:hypothetical protein
VAFDVDPARSIERVLARVGARASQLDYSEASMHVVEALLDEASRSIGSASEEERTRLIEGFGWYILEAGRKLFGGRYAYHYEQRAPVLVTGEPEYHVALMSFPHVAGRLSGDLADNIPFFFEGFASRAKAAAPGDRAIFV